MKSNHYSNHNRCYKGDSRSSGGNVICIASLADDGKKFVNHKALQKAAKLIKKGGAGTAQRPKLPSIAGEISDAFHELGKGRNTALYRIGTYFYHFSKVRPLSWSYFFLLTNSFVCIQFPLHH